MILLWCLMETHSSLEPLMTFRKCILGELIFPEKMKEWWNEILKNQNYSIYQGFLRCGVPVFLKFLQCGSTFYCIANSSSSYTILLPCCETFKIKWLFPEQFLWENQWAELRIRRALGLWEFSSTGRRYNFFLWITLFWFCRTPSDILCLERRRSSRPAMRHLVFFLFHEYFPPENRKRMKYENFLSKESSFL